MGSVRNIIATWSCLNERLEFVSDKDANDAKAISDTLEDFITDNSTVSTTIPSLSSTATTIGSVTRSTAAVPSFISTSDIQVPCPSDTGERLSSMKMVSLSNACIGVLATIENCALVSTDVTTIPPARSCEIATSSGVASPRKPASEASVSSDQDERMMISSLIAYDTQDVSLPYSSYVKSLAPTWIDQIGLVSAQWFDYPLFGHSAVGVKGIYGCTAVIIASEKGVYISHIWESPVFVDQAFNPTDDNFFTITAFNSLRDGTMYAQSVSSLIGTHQNPGVLNSIYAPKVFILTPFTTDWDRRKFGISTTLRYQMRAEELAQKIATIVPGSGGKGTILGYTRTSRQASSQEPGIAGRAILEIDPSYTWLTTAYDSKSAGLQIGRWRLWVEDQLITYQDFWLPHITAPGGFSQRDIG
ncbi:hypothetical protein PITC_044250 [Penicillium italicum]|uniref:Uncharacterized protein n=1 Tax=Penicillium italicum TaxID=40296 RepID=A0A0A2L2W4_PENIT|nr:hypothetical protein PITC_044250 [Penicillium italicum]